MDTTPNLILPYIMAAQAQKHVTHNEAIRALDALVQMTVLDRTLASPPATPADGARYIVAAAPTGAWTGQAQRIAAFQDGAWTIYLPREGWLAWVANEDKLYAFDGTGWILAGGAGGGGGSVNPTPLVGINATADTTNRLSVSAPAVLLNHEGTDHRLKINKAAAANTASLLYQTAFSGRAEVGLAGDDNLRVKVSADGTLWRDAIVVDRSTGAVGLPFTTLAAAGPNLLLNGDFQINQRSFPGGALGAGGYGFDRWKADTGGASLTLSGTTLTLASGAIMQAVESSLWGVANFASTQVTVSVESPNADLSVSFGSATGTITAGSGRRSLTLTTAAGDTGNLALRITKATAGSVTFARVKLELGATATSWQPRSRADEFAACQRYYHRRGNQFAQYCGQGFVFTATNSNFEFTHPAEMRALPTLTVTNPTDFLIGTGGVNGTVSAISISGGTNQTTRRCVLVFTHSSMASVIGQGCGLQTGFGGAGTYGILEFSSEI
ncbi:MAG: DUF2793 domain-containing protein [Hyphomicrobiaceae bacterium]